ncbi:hypothetical protein TTHERM_00495910 (macronuclear) [Tetrahymena thermophila SB210]|uniref:Uncharacterized protein n=1 Tax=Tetrahymena thermophila (strain SB210) TaxID=312017 RepID=I7MMZ9_TETTS|nr:hypothetical protein TTHERM_00495910 [Tetrahymena thermophila SB210]EAS07637.2 hypothetical protein TTHERM_00495910 [Tetrahymena thermophila SB210]|eukprot:XP_001027879.2 hypothetical protein TTHERM_00495910 [Tetrahymena thermophila SB210]
MMNLELQDSIDSNKLVGYQPVTDRLHKKMSVKFRRETQEVVYSPDNNERQLFRSTSRNKFESNQSNVQENTPKLLKQNSMNKMNIYTNAVNVPPFIKENGFFQRKKTFEAFVKDGDKLLKNKDDVKSALLEKIEQKMNRIKYISNNNQDTNDEIIYQEYKRLNSNKSNGIILTNQFWSKNYYDYIIKRSKVKNDLDQLKHKKKMEPTPQLLENFNNYFMDKFIKNADEDFILDEFKKKDSNATSEFISHSQKISNSNSQDTPLNNLSSIKNSNLTNISTFGQAQNNSIIQRHKLISPFQSRRINSFSNEFKSNASIKNQEQLFQKIIKGPKEFEKLQNFQTISKQNQQKEIQSNINQTPSERTGSILNTSENISVLAGQQANNGQHRIRKSSSQISLDQKPALTFFEEQMKEILAKQENKKKNQYATLDFYLQVVKEIDQKRFSKTDKEMIQDQQVKHNLLKETQKMKHQRSQSQMNNLKNQKNFKFESPYSIQNLNYNYSSRHSLRSRQLQNNEERGSMQSLFSASNQDRFSSIMLNDEENEKEILREGMGKLIQTCEQFHHENINIMAVIDKAQQLKDQKKIIKQEMKKKQDILNNLNALIQRKEKEKKQQDPRIRLQKNKKSKYYYVDDD